MAKREEYECKTEQLLEPILKENNFELYDVEFVKEAGTFYLRAFIDKEGGITVNDCEAVAREMNVLLDEKDFIQDAYILEVSSPGLGRTLKKDRHLEKSIGQDVELKLYKPQNGQKEYEGNLIRFDENSITIEAEGEITFAREDIAIIKLALDF